MPLLLAKLTKDERLAQQERENKQQIAARKRARRQSGRRLLLSQDDSNPFLGIPEDTTLGPSTTEFSRQSAGTTT